MKDRADTPTRMVATAKAGAPTFTLVTLTSPMRVNGTVTLSVQAKVDSSCTVTYITPSGNESNAVGTGPATPSSSGVCTWLWNIEPGTKTGTSAVVVTVDGASQRFDLVIK